MDKKITVENSIIIAR